jgi:tetratricopeptide (TPR) repeat protein
MAAAAEQVARIARERGLAEAVAFAKRWERQVGADARLAYELGLASRLAGDGDAALDHLDRAVALDPSLASARYDRGEVLLADGALDRAETDFREVVRLAPDQWAGHFRLADVAGRRGDATAFEVHLLEALRHGFAFRDVVGDPRWSGYLADPALGPVVRRLVVVYQGEEVLEALERAP